MATWAVAAAQAASHQRDYFIEAVRERAMGNITVMSPKDFAEKMQKIAKIGDYEKSLSRAAYEERQAEAVELLCEVLIGLGYSEGVRVFQTIPKRYV